MMRSSATARTRSAPSPSKPPTPPRSTRRSPPSPRDRLSQHRRFRHRRRHRRVLGTQPGSATAPIPATARSMRISRNPPSTPAVLQLRRLRSRRFPRSRSRPLLQLLAAHWHRPGVSGAGAVAPNEINLSVNASIDGSKSGHECRGRRRRAEPGHLRRHHDRHPVTVAAADASSIDALVAAGAVAGAFGGERVMPLPSACRLRATRSPIR